MDDHGKRLLLRRLLDGQEGIAAPSAPDPMFARLIQDCGFKLFHLAGNGVHRSLILPDCSMVTMTEMAERAGAIAQAIDIPTLVDGETGYGGPPQTARAVRAFERAGVAGIRFEDSLFGQNGIDAERPVVSVGEMVDKMKAAADARADGDLVLAVRCDARRYEPREQVLARIHAYLEAGADAIGVHLADREEHRWFGAAVRAPLMNPWPRAGIDTLQEFFAMGYKVALVTSSVSLAALAGARDMLLELKKTGSQDGYFADVSGFDEIRRWYRDLGFRPTKALG
ncbi:MAG TPA: isocitrate lyase/phosphoenolpyruvate mutase family protein [Candidatus Acidoferrales bacterium]|nr:isocitrate lyase/phosphoenolpyruvate mutase family protein [Candidatus Acidoferrales bacterium]